MLKRGTLLWTSAVSAEVDYGPVPDTPAYLSPLLQAATPMTNLNVVGGRQVTAADAEWSLSFTPAALSLAGKATAFSEIVGGTWNTAAGHAVLFLSVGATPGAVLVTSVPAGFSGYLMYLGSGNTGIVHRFNAGVDSGTLGNFAFTSYAGDDIRLGLTVNPANVSLQGYKNGAPIGAPVVDASASRLTGFATAGYSLRQAFGFGASLAGVRAGGA